MVTGKRIHGGDEGQRATIAAPGVADLAHWIIHGIGRAGGDGDEVIGEAGAEDRGEEVVVEREALGVLPVVGDIGLVHLGKTVVRVRRGRRAGRVKRLRAGYQIEAVHLPVIICQGGVLRGVVDIVNLVCLMPQRNNLPIRV